MHLNQFNEITVEIYKIKAIIKKCRKDSTLFDFLKALENVDTQLISSNCGSYASRQASDKIVDSFSELCEAAYEAAHQRMIKHLEETIKCD